MGSHSTAVASLAVVSAWPIMFYGSLVASPVFEVCAIVTKVVQKSEAMEI
jgi:hypothetical protein